jgi:hypothetical protein
MPGTRTTQEDRMLVVRDRSRGGVAVSWGTDHHRMREIADSNPNYEAVTDLTASTTYYWHVEREGMSWEHPYDRSARLEAEIKP